MFWDGVIALLILILSFNGFRRGFLSSWSGLVAMVATTLIVQRFYIDFSCWIESRLHLAPVPSVLVGYLLFWVGLDAALEVVFNTLIKRRIESPLLLDQICGMLYGFLKGSAIVILPIMALSVPIQIPPPPPDTSGLIVPFTAQTEEAFFLLPPYRDYARSLLPDYGKYVVNLNPPSFQPNFGKQSQNQSPSQDDD